MREEDYPKVAIYILGDSVDPSRITQLLKVSPSSSQKKGDIRARSKSVVKHGAWVLSSESRSPDAVRHIEDLLDKINIPGFTFEKIEGVEQSYLDVYYPVCDEDKDSLQIEILLNKKILSRLLELGLSLQIGTIA